MDDDEELVFEIEKHFKVSLYRHELAKATTFGELCELVVVAMNEARPRTPYTFDQFWQSIQEIAVDVLGVPEDEITPSTRFSDLNM